MRLNARAAWLGTASLLIAMALAGNRFAPWMRMGQKEAWAHAAVALTYTIASIVARERARRAGAGLLLAIAGISALSPGWLGLATSAGIYVEPLQAAAYAAAGAWLAWAKK